MIAFHSTFLKSINVYKISFGVKNMLGVGIGHNTDDLDSNCENVYFSLTCTDSSYTCLLKLDLISDSFHFSRNESGLIDLSFRT